MNARGGSLALLLILAGCASTPRAGAGRVTVEVEGRGGDSVQALADAQKRAVEKGLGVALASSTRVEGAVAVRRRIWADARGRVESWKVLGETSEGGLRVVRIRAVVYRLGEGEEVPPPKDATVRVAAEGAAGSGVRRGLLARGFTVVEEGGDFVVTARGASEAQHDARVAPFVSRLGRVSLSLKEAATGEVVWEQSREAGGLGADALAASLLAVESAAELGGRDAADGISRRLWDK